MEEWEKRIEELTKLLDKLEKFLIKLISVVGWLLILIRLFN